MEERMSDVACGQHFTVIVMSHGLRPPRRKVFSTCDTTHSHVTWRGDCRMLRVSSIFLFFDRYCSTVQGLLDRFEVDLGFTELLFIQIVRCCVWAAFYSDCYVSTVGSDGLTAVSSPRYIRHGRYGSCHVWMSRITCGEYLPPRKPQIPDLTVWRPLPLLDIFGTYAMGHVTGRWVMSCVYESCHVWMSRATFAWVVLHVENRVPSIENRIPSIENRTPSIEKAAGFGPDVCVNWLMHKCVTSHIHTCVPWPINICTWLRENTFRWGGRRFRNQRFDGLDLP